MLTDIQSSLRESVRRGAHRVGPFLVHFDDHSDNPFRNYAIPDDGASPSRDEVSALVDAFTSRGRLPRLEYVTPALGVDGALAVAGFTVDARLPLMTIAAGELRAPDPEASIEVAAVDPASPGADADLWDVARVQHSAYTEPGEPGQHDVDRLRGCLDGGGAVALARYDGVPAGAGQYTPPRGGLAEIAAVGVLAGHRSRGIASALVAALTRWVFAAGATPYLQTESHNEGRLYARLGYRTVGQVVAISLR